MEEISVGANKKVADEFGGFEDEVLNAEWTPSHPDLASRAGKQAAREKPLPEWMRRAEAEAADDAESDADFDAEDFMSVMYRSQE
jgi:hypothetical protein